MLNWRRRFESAELLAGAAILLAAIIVYASWFWWGLESPTATGWAIDAITPADLTRTLGFSEGWGSRYPPLHIYILTLVNVVVLAVTGLPPGSPEAGRAFFLAGGMLSLAMALGTVMVVFAIARELRADNRTAILAATLAAFSGPMALYAKTTNLDVPYVFWFSLAIYFWIRWSRTRDTRDSVAMAAFSVFAVTTKDQSAALLILPAALSIGWAIRDGWRTVWPPLAVAVCLSVLILNPITNMAGIREHIALLLGDASQPERMFDSGFGGTLALLGWSVRQMAGSVGWLWLLAGMVGVGLGLTTRGGDWRWRLLGLPIASYAMFFIVPIGYTRDRFWLPVLLIFALCGALLISRLLQGGAWARRAGIAVALLAVAESAARAVSVDLLMACDGRAAVQGWMAAEIPASSSILGIGYVQYMPHFGEHREVDVKEASPDLLSEGDYEYVITTSPYGLDRWAEGDASRRPLEALEAGTSAYRKVLEVTGRPRWSAIEPEGLTGPTNIAKIAPRIAIYARDDSPRWQRANRTPDLTPDQPFCYIRADSPEYPNPN